MAAFRQTFMVIKKILKTQKHRWIQTFTMWEMQTHIVLHWKLDTSLHILLRSGSTVRIITPKSKRNKWRTRRACIPHRIWRRTRRWWFLHERGIASWKSREKEWRESKLQTFSFSLSLGFWFVLGIFSKLGERKRWKTVSASRGLFSLLSVERRLRP